MNSVPSLKQTTLFLAAACLSATIQPKSWADGLDPANTTLIYQGTLGLEGALEKYDRLGWAVATGDFDNNGATDLAIGMPREDVTIGGKVLVDAGIVEISYGEPGDGLGVLDDRPTLFYQGFEGLVGTAETGDQFGFALATGDFNGDGFEDLAVGAPFEDLENNAVEDAGAVQVLYGSSEGLKAQWNHIWTQNSGLQGRAEARDQFGFSLAAGYFDGDPYADLAIGVPREDVQANTVTDAGAVQVLYGSNDRLVATDNQLFEQGKDGLRGQAEDYDLFGWSLVAANFDRKGRGAFDDLVIGIPYENIGDEAKDAGAVQVLYGGSQGLNGNRPRLQIFAQDNSNIVGTAESGDWFGYSLAAADFDGDGHADLAVGIPLEDLESAEGGTIRDGGAVQIFYGKTGGLSTIGNYVLSQRGTIEGEAETNDEFGRSLAAGYFNGDEYADLAVGVPLEDHGTIEDAGAVNILYGGDAPLGEENNTIFGQGAMHNSTPEKGDHFAFALCVGNFNGDLHAGRPVHDLAIGIPRENVNGVAQAGAIQVVFGAR
ncbi:MAG: hypothetical protein AAF657_08400 [Acidobacteriota bacterium]